MKCITAILIAAFGVLKAATACSSHQPHHASRHYHDEMDDMLLRRRRRLSDNVIGGDDDVDDEVQEGGDELPPMSMEMRLGVMERIGSWLERNDQEQQQQQGSLRRRLQKDKYKVHVRFVQIKPNSTVPTIDVKAYKDSLKQVNQDFRGSGFTFHLAESIKVLDAQRFNCSPFGEQYFATGQAYRRGKATMLNILLCDSGPGIAGFSPQPFYLPMGNEFDNAVDAVFLKERNLNRLNILTHEIGQWLGLDHTEFGGCEFPGDGIDDTPYHDYTDAKSCDIPLDTCPDKPGLDPLDNFMSYTKECANKTFTPGQHARMQAVYETFRLNLHETDSCEFEVDIQFDDKPEQIKVMVETNGWYDYLIVHGENYEPNGTYTLSSYFTEGEGSMTIQDQGGDGIGDQGSVSLYLLDKNGDRYMLVSVPGNSVQDMLIVNFTVPSGCAFAGTKVPIEEEVSGRRSSRRNSSSRSASNDGINNPEETAA